METCVVSWVAGRETPAGRWPPAPSAASPSLRGNWSQLSLVWCPQASPGKPSSEPLLGVGSPGHWAWGPLALPSGQVPAGISPWVWEEACRAPATLPALGIVWEDRTSPLHGKRGQGRHPVVWCAGREGAALLTQPWYCRALHQPSQPLNRMNTNKTVRISYKDYILLPPTLQHF